MITYAAWVGMWQALWELHNESVSRMWGLAPEGEFSLGANEWDLENEVQDMRASE